MTRDPRMKMTATPRPSAPSSISTTRIPRPPNSFMLYRKALLKREVDQSRAAEGSPKRETQVAFSRVASARWAQEPKSVKEHFAALAALEKAAHEKAYPGYKYQPRPRSSASKLKLKRKGNGNGAVATRTSRSGRRSRVHEPEDVEATRAVVVCKEQDSVLSSTRSESQSHEEVVMSSHPTMAKEIALTESTSYAGLPTWGDGDALNGDAAAALGETWNSFLLEAKVVELEEQYINY